MDKSKRKNLLVLLFILILIVAGVLMVLSNAKDDKKVSVSDNKETTNKPKTDKDIILNKIKKYNLMALKYFDKDLTFNKEDVSDVTNYSEPMGELLYLYVADNGNISNQKANEVYSDIFGYYPETMVAYNCSLDGEELLSVNSEKQEYYINENHPGHGGRISSFADYRIVDYTEEAGKYTISLALLYGNNAEGYYINDTEVLVDIPDEDDLSETELLNKYKEYLKSADLTNIKKYTYIFEKSGSDNNIVLKEFKRTN